MEDVQIKIAQLLNGGCSESTIKELHKDYSQCITQTLNMSSTTQPRAAAK